MNTLRLFSVAGLFLGTAIAPTFAQNSAGLANAFPPEQLWQRLETVPAELESGRIIRAESEAIFQLNREALQQNLPLRNTDRSVANRVTQRVVIPMPDGSTAAFLVWSDPIMHPDLATRYPEIQTYAAIGADDPRMTARLDLTPQGFHAQIFTPSGTIYVDPYTHGSDAFYISYYRADFVPHPLKRESHRCQVENTLPDLPDQPLIAARSDGSELRTYRLALACTGEYASFHGGTVLGALAAMNTSMNRINGIYERELSVRMELIANNDLLIFLNGSTDPYTNSSGFAMLDQNQSTVDGIIGGANYDIGHVFSTGGGGVANLGSVCSSSDKAKGVTGGFAPVGDPFDVDYVAHEMGHQFRGEHSWNYCGGTGGTGSTDFEPGGGSTIMGYAGICGIDNYATNSDDYLHGANLTQMTAFIVSGSGSGCASVTATGNTAPEITDFPDEFTIPISTPFRLWATATDAESDPMTYCWEQIDGLQNVSLANSPSGRIGVPLFRSFPPSEASDRYFPSLDLLATNSTSRVEFLPDYERSMKFRLTIRDNHPGAGGTTDQDVEIEVDDTGGPFFITEPAGSGVVWEALNWVPIQWEAGGTVAAPFNCSTVQIRMSTDGGYTYPVVLHESVPNNGSNFIYVPDLPGNQVRVMVACNENIFFQINTENLRIENNGTPSGWNTPGELALELFPNPAGEMVFIRLPATWKSSQPLLRITDIRGRSMMQEQLSDWSESNPYALDISRWPSGWYIIDVSAPGLPPVKGKLAVE